MKVFAHYFGKPGLNDSNFMTWDLKRKFEESGTEFLSSKDAEEIWVFDFSFQALLFMYRWPKSKRRLFIFEPRAVNPLQHQNWVRRLFDVSYVFSEGQIGRGAHFVEGGGHSPERCRDLPNYSHERTEGDSSLTVTVAAGDKQSLQAGSLYWLRRDAMESLAMAGYKVKLVGPFWQKNFIFRAKQLLSSFFLAVISGSLPRIGLARPLRFVTPRRSPDFEYIGYVEDEIEFYMSGDIVLVIENDLDSLSEKLFSALCARKWVVYVGPREARALPFTQNVVFAEPTVKSILESVEKISTFPTQTSKHQQLDLQHRSFSAFYTRLVSETIRSGTD